MRMNPMNYTNEAREGHARCILRLPKVATPVETVAVMREMASALRTKLQTKRVREFLAGKVLAEWLEIGSDGEPRLHTLELTIPPLPSAGKSAEATWRSWRTHAAMRGWREFKAALLNRCAKYGGMAFSCDQADDASPNDTYWAATYAADPVGWIKARTACVSHQINHCVYSVLAGPFTVKWTNSMASMSSFFSMGTYLLRCSWALGEYLAKPGIVIVEYGAPSDLDTSIADTLVDYLVCNLGDATDKERLAARQRLSFLFHSLWNTGLHHNDGRIRHKCRGEGCCSNGRPALLLKLATSINATLLTRAPNMLSLSIAR